MYGKLVNIKKIVGGGRLKLLDGVAELVTYLSQGSGSGSELQIGKLKATDTFLVFNSQTK